MAQSQTVKIVEVCQIGPPPELPDSAAPKSLPLTFFDIHWLRFPPLQRIFFYHISSPSDGLFYDSIIPKLKHSLSLTLHHFLPLAGNLIWPQNSHKPILNYVDGDGVSLTIAESSSVDFYHLSGNYFRKATDYHPLLSHLQVSKERAAVMALQVTVFPNSGISIGITSHHAVVDGRTLATFTKLWARTCKIGAESPSPVISELTPFYDRSVIKDPYGAEDQVYVNARLNQEGPNNRSLMTMEFQVPPDSVRGTFEVSREKIAKLKKSVSVSIEPKHGIHVSSFSVICGYTWVCLAKALKISEKKMMFVFSADCRSRLKPTLPPTYFGNCIEARSVVVDTQVLLEEDGVKFAVEAISEAVKGLEVDGVINGGLETWISMKKARKSNQRPVSVASSPRFEVYNTDFGWGRPRMTEVISIDKSGAISLSDSRNVNGGIEIGLVLKMEEMETFASLFDQGVELL